jgi:hypothetical protein
VASTPQENVSRWVSKKAQAMHPLLSQLMQDLRISLKRVERMYEFTNNPTNILAFMLAHEVGHALERHYVSSCVRNHAHPSFSISSLSIMIDLCRAHVHARSNNSCNVLITA